MAKGTSTISIFQYFDGGTTNNCSKFRKNQFYETTMYIMPINNLPFRRGFHKRIATPLYNELDDLLATPREILDNLPNEKQRLREEVHVRKTLLMIQQCKQLSIKYPCRKTKD